MVTVAAPEKLVVGVKTIPLFKKRLILVGEPKSPSVGHWLPSQAHCWLKWPQLVPTVMVTPAGTALRFARVKVPLLLGVRVVVTVALSPSRTDSAVPRMRQRSGACYSRIKTANRGREGGRAVVVAVLRGLRDFEQHDIVGVGHCPRNKSWNIGWNRVGNQIHTVHTQAVIAALLPWRE